jgi:phosphoribosylglycinamide formyltransferase 1
MHILEDKGIELILLIGYMRFISKPFVNKWRYKIMNVHPSLLPKFAGGMDMNVHQAVIDAKEKESGMTIHFVDEGADTGPIILQKKCEIDVDETTETLKKKVQQLEGEGFVEAIKLFSEGKIHIDKNGKVNIS